jgi:hypothetical protein
MIEEKNQKIFAFRHTRWYTTIINSDYEAKRKNNMTLNPLVM